MVMKKDFMYWSVSEIAMILSYLISANVTVIDIYVALSQMNLIYKDIKTYEWKPLAPEGLKFAQERTYNDKKTGEEKMFFVWHRDIIEKLKKYFQPVQVEEEENDRTNKE